MPVLKQVGDAWERGELGVLHEHFVSSTFRGVLGELRMPVQGDRVRTVVLACPPRELHDLPLELFGAMLHARWWRVVSLGANTPMTAIGDAVRHLDADACVLAGVRRSAFESRMPSLTRLGSRVAALPRGRGCAGPALGAPGDDRPASRPAGGGRTSSTPSPPGRAPQRARRRLSRPPASARPTVEDMRITHLGHACLLVEMADTRVLVDPGTFAGDLSAVRDLDAVLVTHQHPDHLDPDRVPALVEANPGRRRPLRPDERRGARDARGRGPRARGASRRRSGASR